MTTISTLIAGSPLRVGSSNRDATLAVLRALNLPETGTYDKNAAEAVQAFQRKHGLDPDGEVGPITAAALDALTGAAPDAKIEVQARSDFSAAPVWFTWALHEVGVHEVGENRGPDIERYLRLANLSPSLVGQPWCAIFTDAAFEVNGIRSPRSASSQAYRSDPNFVRLPGPALGAVAVFWRQSRESGLGHNAFYRGEAADRVYVLGGNEGDAVKIEWMAKDSPHFGLRDYWWPKSVPLPRIGAVPIRSGQPLVQVKVV